MLFLREDTASQELMIGPFVDSTDGVTAETGLTINNTDIRLWKEGGTAFANKNSGGGTHEEDGYYEITLDATDTDTAGKLIGNVTVSGALPVRFEAIVLPTQVYDSFVLGTDNLETDTIQWLGTAVATPSTAGVPEVDVTYVNANSLAAQALEHMMEGIVWETNIASATASTIVYNTPTALGDQDDDHIGWTCYIYSGAGNGQSRIVTDYVASTKTITVTPDWTTTPDASSDVMLLPWGMADVRTVGGAAEDIATGADITGLNDLSAAQVNAEVDTALSDYDAPTKAEMDSGFAALNDPTVAAIADAVLDEPLSGHTTAGTLGKAVADTETDAAAILVDTGTDGVVLAGTPDVNMAQISGDATAADNLEAAFDGTGYDDGGVNRIGANVKEINETAAGDTSGELHVDVKSMTLTLTEPSGMFAWSGTAEDLINVLGALIRNEINVDSNSIDVRNDADSANLFAYAISDDTTTFTNAEGA